MSRLRVTAIVPTYNCAHFIVETVESVLAQTHSPHEIFVVDDGSTDDTEERLRPFLGRIRYFRKENGGVATARNVGLDAMTGDAVAFLDSDDVWHPRKLDVQTAVLDANPDIGLLGTSVLDWPHASFAELDDEAQPSMTPVPFHRLAVQNLFTTSSMIVRREVIEKVGRFDPSLFGPEDHDYWIRCLKWTGAANLESPLTGYRTLPGSLGKRAITMEAGMRRIIEKLDETGAWQGRWLLRRKARAYVSYSCSYMYGAAGRHSESVGRLLGSFFHYPMPLRRNEVSMAFARPRLLATSILRWLKLKKPEAPCQTPKLAAGS